MSKCSFFSASNFQRLETFLEYLLQKRWRNQPNNCFLESVTFNIYFALLPKDKMYNGCTAKAELLLSAFETKEWEPGSEPMLIKDKMYAAPKNYLSYNKKY
jgi:hypothetical protein